MTARVLEAKVLLSLLRGVPRRGTHVERLQAFYGPQADHYDAFRARLLHGRSDLVRIMGPRDGADIVELGGGTGYNLTYFGDRLARMGSIEIVDLCPPLLARARERWRGQNNVRVIDADATVYRPPHLVDCVYFSYSLTMIPNWRAAIDNALAMLKPGGILGVVDFHVAATHSSFARFFWPRWFAHDGVRLSPEPLARLRAIFPDHVVSERMASVPYLPFLRVPYYIFVARR